MCMLLDTRLPISAVYLKLYYKVNSESVGKLCLVVNVSTSSTQLYELK